MNRLTPIASPVGSLATWQELIVEAMQITLAPRVSPGQFSLFEGSEPLDALDRIQPHG